MDIDTTTSFDEQDGQQQITSAPTPDPTADASTPDSFESELDKAFDDALEEVAGSSDAVIDALDNVPEVKAVRVLGQTKWFNDRKGYGFITPLSAYSDDGIATTREHDVFVHLDQISPRISTYKTLYTGEYVEYTPVAGEDGRIRANNVTGVQGNGLMCDFGRVTFSLYYKRHFHTNTSAGDIEGGVSAHESAPEHTFGECHPGAAAQGRRMPHKRRRKRARREQ